MPDNLTITPPLSSNTGVEICVNQDDIRGNLRFPRSFFSFFKDKTDFPLSEASKYCVDKFTALQGYLSVNPPFLTEVFHNAGIQKCCERPPPSVNECLRKKRENELKEYLDSLPKLNFRRKVNAWLSNSDGETTLQERIEPQEQSYSVLSQYYQSDFMNSNILQINDIPHLHSDEFMKLLLFFLFQSLFSSFAGGPLMFLVISMCFLVFLGSKSPVFIFQSITILGSFLDI